jgi:hypothetical protein
MLPPTPSAVDALMNERRLIEPDWNWVTRSRNGVDD